MSKSSTETLIDRSVLIAGKSNGNEVGVGDFYYHSTDLYRHKPTGKFFTIEHGGACVYTSPYPMWMTREEAVWWIETYAKDPITGYGFTREQAEVMVDGDGRQEAGRGYRE